MRQCEHGIVIAHRADLVNCRCCFDAFVDAQVVRYRDWPRLYVEDGGEAGVA